MPFKYAQKEVKGIVYILSFGIGVAIVSWHLRAPIVVMSDVCCLADTHCEPCQVRCSF